MTTPQRPKLPVIFGELDSAQALILAMNRMEWRDYADTLEAQVSTLTKALEHCADAGSTRNSRESTAKQALSSTQPKEKP